jgi:hypothetical protein
MSNPLFSHLSTKTLYLPFNAFNNKNPLLNASFDSFTLLVKRSINPKVSMIHSVILRLSLRGSAANGSKSFDHYSRLVFEYEIATVVFVC